MTSESFRRIASDLQMLHRDKVRKIVTDHVAGRHFYTALDRSGRNALTESVRRQAQNEGDLSQLYYSIRTLEALHGDCFDAITDKALEAVKTIYDQTNLEHTFPVRTLVFIRLMLESNLLLPEEKKKS